MSKIGLLGHTIVLVLEKAFRKVDHLNHFDLFLFSIYSKSQISCVKGKNSSVIKAHFFKNMLILEGGTDHFLFFLPAPLSSSSLATAASSHRSKSNLVAIKEQFGSRSSSNINENHTELSKLISGAMLRKWAD